MEKDRSLEKPRYCCWVLNYRCMFRCKACLIWNIKDDHSQETTLKQKKEFVDSLRGFVGKDFEFHLSGGEPLLTEGIVELVRYISAQGYRTNLVTNGYLINEKLAAELASSGLGTITFSVDGKNAGTHDFLRGMPGSYERIIKAIELIDTCRVNRKPAISILTILMAHNLDQALDMVDWVESDKRLEMISFQAITQPFCEPLSEKWFLDDKNKLFWPRDGEKAGRVMQELRKRKLQGARIGNHQDHFNHFTGYFSDPEKFLKKIKCNLGDYEFHVDPYGKAFFCCLTEPFGNIKTDKIPQIWSSPRVQEIRKSVYHCKKNCHIMINCFYEAEESI